MSQAARQLEKHPTPSNDAPRVAHGVGPHDATLTQSEVDLLNGLSTRVPSGGRTRFDMAQMLADDETLTALAGYRDTFAAAGIDVDAALTTLPHALKLQRLEQRLALAQALVHRHLIATMSPLATLSSDVHRMVGGTPDGSAMRAAFTSFESRWESTFTGGMRGARRAKDAATGESRSPK